MNLPSSHPLTFQSDRTQDDGGHRKLRIQISSLAGAATLTTLGVVVVCWADEDLTL